MLSGWIASSEMGTPWSGELPKPYHWVHETDALWFLQIVANFTYYVPVDFYSERLLEIVDRFSGVMCEVRPRMKPATWMLGQLISRYY